MKPLRIKLLLFAALLIVLSGLVFLYYTKYYNVKEQTESYPEIQEISTRNFSGFEELKKYFQDLAQKKGGRYAFEILRKAVIPPNTDLHLLGHAVGDILYQQEGLKGITACDNDFRNACSHSIVVGLFSDKGESALPEITEACRQAPGGPGAYTMCFHGLGHGILAANGYDMDTASKYCKKTSSSVNNSESTECIGGMIMEIIGGGFHDREIWASQRKENLNPKKPLGLCQQNFIPEEARFMCYIYLTPFLFEAADIDLGKPDPALFGKSFAMCNALPINDKINRDACFGGFGKEFIGMVQARDIRQEAVKNISTESFDDVYEWCQKADNKDGTAACIVHGMNSLFWGGENDRIGAERFCGVIQDNQYNRDSCFQNLITSVGVYVSDQAYRQAFCAELPEDYQQSCRERLAVK